MTHTRERQILIGFALALTALGAVALDSPVVAMVHSSGLDGWLKGNGKWVATILKIPGEFWTAIVCAVLAIALKFGGWRGALLIALVSMSSISASVVKWIVGRTRPLKDVAPWDLDWFRGGIDGIGHQENLAFPSGHACHAFALAAAMAILLPRYRWIFFALACVTSLERVMENAHYVSDVTAAAALGAAGTWGVHALLNRKSGNGASAPSGHGVMISSLENRWS